MIGKSSIERGGGSIMTNGERMAASIDQIYTYGNCQYTKWRVAVVKSIQKILLNLDDF